MTTFWTGSALAADYGQGHALALRRPTHSAQQQAARCEKELAMRQQAFRHLNMAIRAAMLAQLDEQEASGTVDECEVFMHADGCESYLPLTTSPY